MSFWSGVRVLKSKSGISTLITFCVPAEIVSSCFGASSAVFSISSGIPARASMKFRLAETSAVSTSSRSALFSRTLSRNWRISSSRLSFRSLCPRTAVTSFFFSRVSSILVGFTWVPATAHHTFP